ncbi:MAG TPA: hypothetical protein VGB70_08930 [Allosphingosinicella sp.]|jgi:hypothetical protein
MADAAKAASNANLGLFINPSTKRLTSAASLRLRPAGNRRMVALPTRFSL